MVKDGSFALLMPIALLFIIQISKTKSQNPKAKFQKPKFKKQNPKHNTQNPISKSQISSKIQNSNLKRPDPRLKKLLGLINASLEFDD
jgi:hypothetical protein